MRTVTTQRGAWVLMGLACLAWGLAACAVDEPGHSTRVGMWHGGLKRQYRVYVPTGYEQDNPAPLVFMFHGGLGSSRQLENAAEMDAQADRTGALVVYPDGVVATWNAGRCCGPPQRNNLDDVSFVMAVLDDVAARFNVDRSRIYAAGMSNGAMFSYRLACERPDVFAAVAPVAGTRMVDCVPSRPVAVMHVHGRQDAFVPWGGGVGCGPSKADMTPVEEGLETFASAASCGNTSTVVADENGVTCRQRDGCVQGAEVTLCEVGTGGHSWPGRGGGRSELRGMCPEDGEKNTAWEASQHIMDFLLKHRRGS